MKKFLSVMIAILMVVMIIPATLVSAGGRITYMIEESEGAVTVIKIEHQTGEGTLVIPSTYEGYPVKAIGPDACQYALASPTTLIIPEGVVAIGDNAFKLFGRLRDISVPASVTYIGENAFAAGRLYCLQVTHGSCAYNYVKENGIDYTLFYDVFKNDWYKSATTFVAENRYMTGYAQGNLFGPADDIKRQDFVVTLARMSGDDIDGISGDTPFADVPEDSYYAKAVAWANQNGIATGYSHNDKFGVGDNITREQAVTMLYRYASGYRDMDVSVSGSPLSQYEDCDSVSDFAVEAVNWAIDKGVISGMNNTLVVNPLGNSSRAQVAKIIQNLYTKNIFA